MSKHRREKSAREITCDRIVERVAQLVDPWTEPVSHVVAGKVVTNLTEQPPLLEQLGHETPQRAGTAPAGMGSRPPLGLESLSALQDIAAAVEMWWGRVDRLGTKAGRFAAAAALAEIRTDRPQDLAAAVGRLNDALNAGVGEQLRRIASAAPTLPDETLWNLDRDVASWWIRARTVTTWADPPMKPHVPCSECTVVGRIQVRTNPTTAYCLECGTAWDGLTIDQLGTHVQLLVEQDAALRTERQIEHRTCATCGEHHDPGHYTTDTALAAHAAAAPAELHGAMGTVPA